MAKFTKTQQIIRNAPPEQRAQLGRVTGFRRFSNYMVGLDKYGRPLEGGAKFGSKVASTLNPLMFASTITARNTARGTAVGAKNIKQANKAQLQAMKNKAEIVLTIASLGGFAGAKAGVKAGAEAAKAAKGLAKVTEGAKGFKAGKEAYKASKLASKAAKAGTTATKTAGNLGDLAANPYLGKTLDLPKSETQTLIEWGSQAGKSELATKFKVPEVKTYNVLDEALTTPLKPVEKIKTPSKFVKGLKELVGDKVGLTDDEMTLIDDFLVKRQSSPDDKFFDIAKEFAKENKTKLNDAALKRSQQALKAAWKKYQEENPDATPIEGTTKIQEDRGSNVYDKGYDFNDPLQNDDMVNKYGLARKYATGGMIEGKSHANGGEKAKLGDTNIEVEGGERIFSVKDTNAMDRDAEQGNYSALGKKYAAAKQQHDAQGSDGYAQEGEKLPTDKKDLNWAYKQAKAAGAPFPQVTAAQWALESARGDSLIAKETNNYFGIKYNETAAEKLRAKGIEVKSSAEVRPKGYYDKMEKSYAPYMYFPNPADAFKAHQYFLETNPRYAEALKADNATAYAKGLKAAGYATDPNYASKLISFFGDEKQATKNFGEVVEDPKVLATARPNEVALREVTKADIKERTLKNLDKADRRKYQAYKAGQTYTDIYAEKLMKDKWNYLRKESEGHKQWAKDSGFQDAEDKLEKLDLWIQKMDDEYKTWKDGTGFFESDWINDMPIEEVTMLYPELIPDEYKGKDGKLNTVELFSALKQEKKKAQIERNDIYAKRMSEAAPKLLDDAYKSLGSIKNSPEFKALSVKEQAQVIENLQTQIKEFKQLKNETDAYNSTSSKARLARNVKAASKMNKEDFIKEYGDIVGGGKLAYGVSQGGVSWSASRGQTANVSKEADKLNIKQGDAFFDKKYSYMNLGNTFKISDADKDAFKTADYLTETDLKKEYLTEKVEAEAELEAEREADIDRVLREAEEVMTNEADDNTYDAETEEEIDTTLFSDAQVQEFLNRKDEQRAATGLSGIYEKFKGVDQVLQMTGMYAAYKSATEPVPEQRKSQQWQDYMATMKQRAQSGIDPETQTLFQRQAERTYASDVSSIGRMATSAQSALGALGQASRRKYAADMQMGAQDAQLREQHFGEYAKAVGVDENMTQQMWERNVYNEASRKRDLKAGLIGQAVKNVRDDIMYNQQYGDGSMYAQLMQESIKEKEEAQRSMKVSQLKTMYDAGYTAEQAVTALGGTYKKDENE